MSQARVGLRVQWEGITSTNRAVMRFGKILSGLLQGMEDTLAQQGEACPAIAHTFDQLQLVDFADLRSHYFRAALGPLAPPLYLVQSPERSGFHSGI